MTFFDRQQRAEELPSNVDAADDKAWRSFDLRRFVSEASTTCGELSPWSDEEAAMTRAASDGMESLACSECESGWDADTSLGDDCEACATCSRSTSKTASGGRSTSDILPCAEDVYISSYCTPALDRAPQELLVRACTWNLFGRPVSELDEIERWLLRGERPDVLAIGLQELVELCPATALMDQRGNEERLAELQERVERALHRLGAGYRLLCSIGMVGLASVVYVREELADSAERLECLRIRTGFGGALGNKGAVCVRAKVAGFSLCFINVHLPSGEGPCKATKRDHHLSKVLAHAATSSWLGAWLPRVCAGGEPDRSSSELLSLRHHLVVVLGDFNSRRCQDEEGRLPRLPAGAVASRESGAGDRRLREDELLNGMFGSGLAGFQEGAVHFEPTFGYVPGSDCADPRRKLSWTDRVMFKASRGASVQLEEYDSLHELRHTSDHRPVAALMRVAR